MTEQEDIVKDYFLTNSPLSDIANKPPTKLKNFNNEIDGKIRLLTSKTKNYFPSIHNKT